MTQVVSFRYSGDEVGCQAHLSTAKNFLAKTIQAAEAAGHPTFSNFLPNVDNNGSSIFVQRVGTVDYVHIYVAPTYEPPLIEEPKFPVKSTFRFLSGAIYGGLLTFFPRKDGSRGVILKDFAPTVECMKQFKRQTKSRHPESQLNVQPTNLATMGEPNWDRGGNKFGLPSQYNYIQSAMYSGTMRAVVQCVSGFGVCHGMPFTRTSHYSTKFKDASAKYVARVLSHGFQIEFNYKFYITHGIYKGADGSVWLVEVSFVKGVRAMLLPMFYKTDIRTNPHAADLFRAAGLEDVAQAIEKIGGIPTGEGFPILGKDQDIFTKRGDIIQLCGPEMLAGFYRAGPFAEQLGWCFNDAGNEAHNTGFFWTDKDIQFSHHWQLKINIALNKDRTKDSPAVGTGTAICSYVSGSYLGYGSMNGSTMVPFKFWQNYPMGYEGLYSHDARPVSAEGRTFMNTQTMDAPLFVCYINGSLHVVKFAAVPGEKQVDIFDGDIPECKDTQSYSWTRTYGAMKAATMVYSNFDDFRQPIPEQVETFSQQVQPGQKFTTCGDYLENIQFCWYAQQQFMNVTTSHKYTGNFGANAAVCLPKNCREAYYYAQWSYSTTALYSKATFTNTRENNTSYGGYRNLFGGWWDWFNGIAGISPNCGPYDPNGGDDQRKVCNTFFGVDPCGFDAEFASHCEPIFPHGGPSPPPSTLVTVPSTYNFTGRAKFYSNNGDTDCVVLPLTEIDARQWAATSPEPPPLSLIHWIFAGYSGLGQTAFTYCNGLNTAEGKHYGPIPDWQSGDNGGAGKLVALPTYIGVI